MRTTILRGFITCLALLASGRSAWAGGGSAIVWHKSLPAAQAEAKRSHKLLMVDFYTSWCTYCKKMDAETYTNAKIVQMSGQVVTVKVDAERDGKRLAEKYGVDVYPTILFLNEKGGVEGMMGGFVPAVDFAKNFTGTMKRHQKFVAAQTRFKQNSNDVQAAFELEGFYAAHGSATQTIAMQKEVERLDPHNAKGLLARSCLYLGDFYSMRNVFDKSTPLYRRAIQLTKVPRDLAYGHLSLAYSHLSQRLFKEAVPELKAAKAVPNCPLEIKGAANEMLIKLKNMGVQ